MLSISRIAHFFILSYQVNNIRLLDHAFASFSITYANLDNKRYAYIPRVHTSSHCISIPYHHSYTPRRFSGVLDVMRSWPSSAVGLFARSGTRLCLNESLRFVQVTNEYTVIYTSSWSYVNFSRVVCIPCQKLNPTAARGMSISATPAHHQRTTNRHRVVRVCV
jgi:hypothetical protein